MKNPLHATNYISYVFPLLVVDSQQEEKHDKISCVIMCVKVKGQMGATWINKYQYPAVCY